MKNKIKKWKKQIVSFFQELRKNPKEIFNHMKNGIIDCAKHNTLFLTFVITCVVNALLLRFLTMHTLENYLSIKPVLADLGMVLLLGSFAYFFKPKNRIRYLMTLEIFFTFICLVNSIYYTFYTSFASISMISLAQFIAPVGDAVAQNVFQIKDVFYLWGPITLGIMHFVLKKKGYYDVLESKERRKKRWKKTVLASFASFVLFALMLSSLDIGRFTKQWNREYVVMQFGIYTYQISDVFTSLKPKLTSLFGYDKAMKSFHEYFENNEKSKTNEYTDLLKGKNVIAIHAESMQSFVMGLKFNGVEVTPTLNKLAKEGMFFSNFYSQVSVGTSSDTELTLSTSLMPPHSGTAFVSYFDRKYNSIQLELKKQGYTTFTMHGNTADFWNRRLMYQSLGIDRFYSKKDFDVNDTNQIGLGISDKAFFSQSIPYLEEIKAQGKPFYGTYIMLTNHTPFSDVDKYGEFPVDWKEEITDENGQKVVINHPYMEGTKLGNYFKSIHYADAALGEFLASLEEKNLLENTVIMLYGDHDARLPKEDYVRLYNYNIETDSIYDKSDSRYVEFGNYQYELARKVPLIFWDKDKTLQGTFDYTMGMYDVMPTLGNMMGFYNKYQLGHDIFNIKYDNVVIFPNNANWVTNKVYYNSQKGEAFPLKDEPISQDYIDRLNEYTDKLLEVSNNIIVFDLFRKEEETQALLSSKGE